MTGLRRLLISNSQDIDLSYTELEYAIFNGSSYLDLGVKADLDTRVYIRFYDTKSSGSLIIGDVINEGFALWTSTNNKLMYKFSTTGSEEASASTLSLNEWHTIVMDKTGITLDESSIDTFSVSSSFQTTNTLQLGNIRNFSSSYIYSGRIAVVRIFESNVLTHEFIPVKNSNNIVCFFDKCTNRFIYPTGTLSGGREIHRVNYLTSSNKAYIDTKIARWNNTIEEEIKCTIETQSSGYRNWWGAYDVWTSSGRQVPNIGTYHALKTPASFKAGTSSSSGVVNIGIQYGQTGIFSLKGNTVSWSEGTSATFDRLESQPFTMNQSIGLFCTHKGTSFDQFGNVTIYYAKFWINNELVGHFKPAHDENNVGFMFDEITHQIFDNAGSGSFSYPTE